MSNVTHVPKFGKWDANDPTPYTVMFEKARADHKGGVGVGNKIMNPNDPTENPAFLGLKSSAEPPSSRKAPQKRHYADEFDKRANLKSGGPNVTGGPPRSMMAEHARKGSHGGLHDDDPIVLGEGHYGEQSPRHLSLPFKGHPANRPAIQPSNLTSDRKGAHEGGSLQHHTARTRMRPGLRGEDTLPERSPALPKFGDWNEKGPSSGDGYTVMFSHARQERMVGGAARLPGYQVDSPLKVDHDDAFKPSHQPLHRKAASWMCCYRE